MSGVLFNALLIAIPLAIMAALVTVLVRMRREQQSALREASRARDRLNDALEGSMLAVFDWNSSSGTVRLSPTWPVMLGGAAVETFSTGAELLRLIHPEDVPKVHRAIIGTLKGTTPRYDIEHRVRRLDGTYLWVHSRGKVTQRSPDGRATAFAGTNADITARVNAERRLMERELQLRQLIDAMPAAIVVFGRDERILFHNRMYAGLMNTPSEGAVGRRVKEVIGPEVYAQVEDHVATALSGRVARFEQQVQDATGRLIDQEVVYTPLHDSEGGVSAGIAVRFDITRLKDLERMKDHFVAVASHELRTPLTSMRGSLGLLQGGVVGQLSEEAAQLVNIAMQNCERLVRLVNDLLDLEKMAAGRVSFRIGLLDWNRVLTQAIESSRGFVESYGVRFELLPMADLQVRGDEDRLIQVLSNLLFNAAKFSPRGSVVTVSAEQRPDGWIRTSVRDRGPGIPTHFRPRMFQRFAQASMGEDRPSEGSGLGLAISREIVEHLGGRIGFDSAQDGGTVFWFDLWGAPRTAMA